MSEIFRHYKLSVSHDDALVKMPHNNCVGVVRRRDFARSLDSTRLAITRNSEHNRLPCATAAAGSRPAVIGNFCIMRPGLVDPFTKYQDK